MKSYLYPTIFFRKKWIWFSDPNDVGGVDMINFFSYNKTETSGFKRKKGLTSVIDLSRGIDAIWEDMRKNFIRKQIRRGERNGIEIRQDGNFKEFARIYKTFRKDKSITHDKCKAFRDNGILFSAYHEGRMIAGGVFIADGEFIRAWALASVRLDAHDGKMRDIIGQANRMIVWEAIKYARNTQYKIFDFGGINPDSPDMAQRSLAEFKEAFGGERKECYYYHKTYSRLLMFFLKLRKV